MLCNIICKKFNSSGTFFPFHVEIFINVIFTDFMCNNLLFSNMIDCIPAVFFSDFHSKFFSLFLLSPVTNRELSVNVKFVVLFT